ncbi:MAG: PstS family phosphate ABC transporter substrate-binding protein [Planctomycetia bacterium]|nr:PstS family phosphate ABC transporter substrate-binding protein [Planctomycetia bacterium]
MRSLFTFIFIIINMWTVTVWSQEIRIDGSTTVGPICDAFVEAFLEKYPDQKFSVKKTGSGDGAAALAEGRCEIAAMSRLMKPDEFREAAEAGKMPIPFTVAMDGVCLIVNPANSVKELTGQQVRNIYSGKITNWKEVGGPDMPIVAISRDTSSGTYEVFYEIAMKKTKLGSRVEYSNANPAIFSRVATTKGAIGYVGLGFVKKGVVALKYDGIAPNKSTIASGRYTLARPLFLYTNGYPSVGSRLLEYCNYFLTEEGSEIIEAKGFVPMTEY